MPELPEVETVRRGLAPRIEGEVLRGLTLYRPDLRYPFPLRMAERFVGRELQALRRRAKFLIFDFGGDGFLGHLGMSGSYRVAPLGEARLKHDHMALEFGDFEVIYHDPRRFGAVDVFEGEALSHPWLLKLGVEPLGNAFGGGYLAEVLRGRKSSIKSALLNQNIVAGLGNIYVSEALWQSGISPLRSADGLSAKEADALAENIRDVLERALKSGGSTLRDYRNAEGGTGYFQHEFHVYDQEGEDCKNGCGAKIMRIAQSGRSSFYCPKCQKK